MPLLSATSARIGASPTVAMSNLAMAMIARGEDVVALAAGEPDFGTPEHVRAAAKRAIDEGRTRYTPVDGIPELKAAIRAKFAEENGLRFAQDEVIVSVGGKQAIFNAMLATIDPGDEVIIPAPYWTSYPDIVRLCGGTPVIVGTTPSEGFRLAPDALEEAIGERAKWLILNSPGNPTGAGYSSAQLEGLAEVVRRHPGLHVLSDDIYEHITYDGFEFATFAAVAPDLASRTLTVNGVSKSHAMTGWRIGYAGGSAELIGAMKKIQSQSTTNPASISQYAALAALTGPDDHIAEGRALFARRRAKVVEALDALDGVDCAWPDGAFYVFPSVSGLLGRTSPGGRPLVTDEDVSRALLAEAGVATVFGAAFGGAGHIRISYAAADDALDDALERIARFHAGLT